MGIISLTSSEFFHGVGVQRRLAVIDWDYPVQVLLSLASAVEADMGGSSGAVS